jgi:hypothetical protein
MLEQCTDEQRGVGVARSVLITAILLPQRPSCYSGKTVSLRMLTNFRLAGLRLTTAQQRSAGQNLTSDLQTVGGLCYSKGDITHSFPVITESLLDVSSSPSCKYT